MVRCGGVLHQKMNKGPHNQHLRTILASARQRFATLDADSRTWVDGTVATAYHPSLPKDFQLPDLADHHDDAPSNTLPRFTQRTLSAVINASAWLDAKEACDRFDVANVGATVPNREATRLVSYSQAGAGAFLMRLPDVSVRGSVVDSTDFRSVCQRRLGLYVSCLSVPLDACEERGVLVTQHESRLPYISPSDSARARRDGLPALMERATAVATQ